MAQMKELAIEMDEAQARFIVFVPFGDRRYFRHRALALAFVAKERALGRAVFLLGR